MGIGGYLIIINATGRLLQLLSLHSYQMESWSFNDIPSQSMQRFYIEFGGNKSNASSDDSGEAHFLLEGTNESFVLQVRWPNKSECGLKVDWGNVTSSKYALFPPPSLPSNIGELGWFHNGVLSLLILEKSVKTSIATEIPGAASIVAKTSTLPFPVTPLYSKWMEHYSDLLGKLTMTEMTLPGTHDSGTYKPVNPIGTLWVRTQNIPLSKQLDYGIRVLDLRIGQNSPGDYIITHDVWRTSYSLQEALSEVTQFINSTKMEIVILDFHRFVKLGSDPFDYNQLKDQIHKYLSGYTLPFSEGNGKTLQDIWSTSGTQRIIVAWNTDSPDSYMWPGVNQRWYQDADSLQKLYEAIKADMGEPPTGMWATCSFMKSSALHNPSSNAIDTDPTITQWYFGGSSFCEKSNIISVDFFEEHSNVVQASIIGSALKAGAK
jgi:hypothetical protein